MKSTHIEALETIIYDIFSNKIGIDQQVADSVLDEEQYNTAFCQAYNWMLSEQLLSIGIQVRINSYHRSRHNCSTWFTVDFCRNIYYRICELREDFVDDYVGLVILQECIDNKAFSEMDISFKGIRLFDQCYSTSF